MMGLVKRNKVWWMSFTYQGRQVRRSTGTSDRRLAEAVLGKVRTKIVEGQYFDKLEEHERTVGDMLTRYVEERITGGTCHGERRGSGIMGHLMPVFGTKTLAQVSPKDLVAYRVQRQREEAAPATIVRELAFLKAAYNVAIREWEWCRDNPVRRISMLRVNNARVRYLDDETFALVYQACPAWLQPLVLLARYTGLRRENIVSLTWQQVDLPREMILLERTKNGDRLGMPMCQPVVTMLTQIKNGRTKLGGPVFLQTNGEPVTGDMVTIGFRRTCMKLGVVDFRFHDLRHTFASALVQRGVDLYRVQRLLGHRDGRMTQRYAHLAPENLREAVQVFGAGFSTNLAQGTPAHSASST
jgi:integrase